MPSPPQALLWLDKVEQWGFPNQGTWMDQPRDWLTDIEQARIARDAFLARPKPEETGENLEAAFKDKPVTGRSQ